MATYWFHRLILFDSYSILSKSILLNGIAIPKDASMIQGIVLRGPC